MFKGIKGLNISKLINAYKSASSRLIKKEYPLITSKLWKSSFWSKSFCLMTTGSVTIDVIKQYINTRLGKEMNKNIALKIRIYPNKKQSHKINKNLGCLRYVYNHLLNTYLETGKVVSYKELYNDDNIWLKESDTSSYSNVQINLKKAIKNHVNNPKKFGKPVFKYS